MKQLPIDKGLEKGDICQWIIPIHCLTGLCILVEKYRGLKSGNWWKILLDDGTISLVSEENLEKVVNQ